MERETSCEAGSSEWQDCTTGFVLPCTHQSPQSHTHIMLPAAFINFKLNFSDRRHARLDQKQTGAYVYYKFLYKLHELFFFIVETLNEVSSV